MEALRHPGVKSDEQQIFMFFVIPYLVSGAFPQRKHVVLINFYLQAHTTNPEHSARTYTLLSLLVKCHFKPNHAQKHTRHAGYQMTVQGCQVGHVMCQQKLAGLCK